MVQATNRYAGTACRCHGLSGSCSMKTCWKRPPSLSEVGDRLRVHYDEAQRVTMSNDDGRRLQPLVRLPTSKNSPRDSDQPLSDEALVYSDESPDYCRRNRRLGSLGTRGRVCDPRSLGFGGCSILCCGRGHRTRTVRVVENCRCRFYWCCEVHCQTCVVTKTVHKCR